MYLSNNKQFTSFDCPLNAIFFFLRRSVPQDAGTPSLLELQIICYLYSTYVKVE
jgi:hypothetical protein